MSEAPGDSPNVAQVGPAARPSRKLAVRLAVSLAVAASLAILLLSSLGVAVVGWKQMGGKSATQAKAEPLALPQRLSRPEPPKGEYIGSEACQPCHTTIAETYRGHPMSRSLTEIANSDAPSPTDDEIEFSRIPSRKYRVETRPATEEMARQEWHHEIGLAADGEVLFDQRVPVRYVIGSGRRGRAFLIDREGWLFMSPISWYARGDKWDLSPEYDPQGHPRFERPASERCLTCHAGRQSYAGPKTTEIALQYRDPPFTELAIGCERCHGPGAEHVRWRKAKGAHPGNDPIVNPAKLDPPRRESVCNQCHLQGAFQILRYGKHHDDFRPGDHLGDVWSVFVSGTGIAANNATLAVSHVEQMTASRCYERSQGKLGCISCHDPHSFPPDEDRESYYASKCLKCHASRGCALPDEKRQAPLFAGACTACHMPPLTARDVPHTAQTDHRILRNPSAPNNSSADSKEEGLMLFDQPYCPLNPVELSRAQGLVVALQAESNPGSSLARQAEQLLRPAREAARDDVDVIDSLAAVCALQGKSLAAVSLWEETLEIDPQRLGALYALAMHYHEQGNLLKASEFLDRLLSVNPWHADAIRRRADVHARLGQTSMARRWAERAIELNPSTPQSYQFLAELLERQGDSEAAQNHRAQAKKLGNPRNP